MAKSISKISVENKKKNIVYKNIPINERGEIETKINYNSASEQK